MVVEEVVVEGVMVMVVGDVVVVAVVVLVVVVVAVSVVVSTLFTFFPALPWPPFVGGKEEQRKMMKVIRGMKDRYNTGKS